MALICPHECDGCMQLRVTAGEAQLRAFRKEGSPRETFRCGRCLDRMIRHLEDDNGNLFRKVMEVQCCASSDDARLPPCLQLLAAAVTAAHSSLCIGLRAASKAKCQL